MSGPEPEKKEVGTQKATEDTSPSATTGSVAVPRIYTRCPACFNETLCINEGHLLCTWHECPDPTLIDKLGKR